MLLLLPSNVSSFLFMMTGLIIIWLVRKSEIFIKKATIHLTMKRKLYIHLIVFKWLGSHTPVLSFFFSPYRWHFQPVPTQIQSRSQQVFLRGWSNLKCCGSWAQYWPLSSSSSLSSPSCSLRSKRLFFSVILLCACLRLNCGDTCDCKFLLVASGMVMRHATLCHMHRAAHTPNCSIQFPYHNIQCNSKGTKGGLIGLSPQNIFSQFSVLNSTAILNNTMRSVSRNGSWHGLPNDKYGLAVRN